MTATPAATSPQGWVSGPRAIANQGDMLSMPVCHFGIFFGGLGSPSFRQRRQAIRTKTAPMRILTASAARDGAVLFLGGLLTVTSTVKAMTIASDASQPKMKAAPFLTPPCEANTSMNAVKGIGSRLIANPMSTRLRISTRNPCQWTARDGFGHATVIADVPQHGESVTAPW